MLFCSLSNVMTFPVSSEKVVRLCPDLPNHILLALITPHAQRERGKVIGLGVVVYIYICLWSKKCLNRTLVIDLPFQTFAVGLLFEFIDWF